MSRRAFWLILSFVCLFGLLGLVMVMVAQAGGTQQESGSSAEVITYTVTLPVIAKDYPQITIWHWWNADFEQEYADIVLDYSKDHPDVSVNLIYAPDMWSALSTAIPEETGPDIVAYPNDQIGAWASAGYLVPLDPLIDPTYLADNFEPVTVDGVTWNGQLWGIPDTQEGIALVYNRDIITDTEIPAPNDFDGMLTKAMEYRASNPDDYYLCNQGLGNPDAYHVAPIYFGFGMDAYGGYVDEDGIVYMTKTEALNTAEWIYDFSFYAPVTTTHQICRDMLISGESAIWWTGPWAISDLQDQGINYGIAPMGSPFVSVRSFMLTSIAVDRGKAEAAIDLIKYIGSFEVQKRLTLANNTVPANTAALNDPDVRAIYEIAQFGASLSLGIPMENHIYAGCQWDPVGEATTAIWDGIKTPAEAMEAAQTAIEECVASMGP
jgi:arabinogalactan oligomer/maltooligosaccharide transport system substrate-binding protein